MATQLTITQTGAIGWYQDGEHADGSQQTPPVGYEGVLNRVPYQIQQNVTALFNMLGGYTSLFQIDNTDGGLLLLANSFYQYTANAADATQFKMPTDKVDPTNSANRVALVTGDVVRIQHVKGNIASFPFMLSGNGGLINGVGAAILSNSYFDFKFTWNGTSWDMVSLGGAAAGSGIATPVRFVSTANVATLSGLTNVPDGVAIVAGDSILLTAQADATQNGIWMVATGSWVRTGQINPSMLIPVAEGTAWADSVWQVLTNAPITVGTTALSFGLVNQRWVKKIANSAAIVAALTLA